MPAVHTLAIALFEIALPIVGLVLLWRHILVPLKRGRSPAPQLNAWEASIPEFLLFLLFAIGGFLVLSFLVTAMLAVIPASATARKIFVGMAALQFGVILGVLAFWAKHGGAPPWRGRLRESLVSGVITFVVAWPIIIATANLWELLLRVCRLPLERQDLIGMFASMDSPWLFATMFVLATVIAPVAEELLFRAGFFRFLRTRTSRPVALIAPAVVFASMHVEWTTLRGLVSFGPLAVLAILFALAYERTGQIGTPIVAHALFNLNTVVLILSGLAK